MTIFSILLSLFIGHFQPNFTFTEGSQNLNSEIGIRLEENGSQSTYEFIRPEDGNL